MIVIVRFQFRHLVLVIVRFHGVVGVVVSMLVLLRKIRIRAVAMGMAVLMNVFMVVTMDVFVGMNRITVSMGVFVHVHVFVVVNVTVFVATFHGYPPR